jgi:hypothetical protein
VLRICHTRYHPSALRLRPRHNKNEIVPLLA